MFTPFEDATAAPIIRGFLHQPTQPNHSALALTHGAGGNCKSKLLVAVAEALAATGFTVLRFDLPFRQARPFGPPRPGAADQDRAAILRAVTLLKSRAPEKIFLAGHSYGGRQSSILLADHPDAADGLLLLSYPLHPPNKPDQLRTQHFPQLRKPAFFVHGTRDPFATTAELKSALTLIPAPHTLLEVENAAHDLARKKSSRDDLATRIAQQFQSFAAATN